MKPASQPWYLRAFIAVSAWFTALFGLGWFSLILRSNESLWLLAGLGLLVFSQFLARRQQDSEFLDHMLLALGMMGRGAALFGLGDLIDHYDIACGVLALLEPLWYFINPSFSGRFLATLSGLTLGTIFIAKAWPQAPLPLATGLSAALLIFSLELAPRYAPGPADSRYRPMAWAAAFALAVWPVWGESWMWILRKGHPSLFTSQMLALALAVLAWRALRPKLEQGLIGLLALGGLAWLLRYSPATLAALLLGYLAFRHGEKGMLALAQAALIAGITSYYYHLNDTLLLKSAKLGASGLLLLLLAAWLTQGWGLAQRAKSERQGSWRGLAALALLVLVCSGVTASAFKAEGLKSQGVDAYLELAPRDPRDPLLGDYMALNYSIANQIREARYQLNRDHSDGAGQAWCELGPDKILRYVTLYSGQAPAPGHYAIAYVKKGWNVSLGVDQAYFQEGDEPRFRSARYGKFRILDNGSLVWIGLCGADLRPL